MKQMIARREQLMNITAPPDRWSIESLDKLDEVPPNKRTPGGPQWSRKEARISYYMYYCSEMAGASSHAAEFPCQTWSFLSSLKQLPSAEQQNTMVSEYQNRMVAEFGANRTKAYDWLAQATKAYAAYCRDPKTSPGLKNDEIICQLPQYRPMLRDFQFLSDAEKAEAAREKRARMSSADAWKAAQQESIKRSRAAMRKYEADIGITPGMSKAEKRAQRAKLQAQHLLDSRDAKLMSRGEWAEISQDRLSYLQSDEALQHTVEDSLAHFGI